MSHIPQSSVLRVTGWLALATGTVCSVPACSSDDAAGPRRLAGDAPALFSFTSAPGLPPVHSNRIKYRDQGLKPGTGRAGSAQISVRALVGLDPDGFLGTTLLEVTTGTFDNGSTAPGQLTKLQVKQLDAAGRPLSTVSFNQPGNGGHAQLVLEHVVPGSMLLVTAHVSGIDKGRTGVVTIAEQAKYRPDLVALDVRAPERAPPNVPVNISALVGEANGDVGARADCVLLVDGVEVDRARDIWVDAGSLVTCAFTHAFASEGSRQLRVKLEGVTPGEWSPDNNVATGQILIRDLQQFYYEANAAELEKRFQSTRTWHAQRFTDTNVLQWTLDQTEDIDLYRNEQRGDHLMWLPVELTFPLARLEMEHATNGTVLAGSSATGVPAQWGESFDGPDWGFRYSCAVDYTDGVLVTHLYLEVCARRDYVIDPAGTRHETRETVVSNWRWAGEVTFLSSSFFELRFGDGSTVTDSWVSNFAQQAGPVPPVALGATYTMRLAVQGSETGALVHANTAVVPLDRAHVPWWVEQGLGTGTRYQQPETCVDTRFDASNFYELWRVCDTLDDFEVGRSGRLTNLPSITP